MSLISLATLLVAVLPLVSTAPHLPPTHRPLCQPGVNPPPNRFNSTARLNQLRDRMTKIQMNWYLETGLNRMLSAPQPSEQYRNWLSGFTGSSGQVMITINDAHLFTDTRYTLQADQELQCDWYIYDSTSLEEWVKTYNGSVAKLAVDSRQIRASTYGGLQGNPLVTLQPLQSNLVDEIWVDNRPQAISQDIYPLALNYTGKTWQAKVDQMRTQALGSSTDKADFLVVSGLDETAYLLNLRATVLASFPYFPSIVLLSTNTMHLFVDNTSYFLATDSLRKHLNLNIHGSCESGAQVCVTLVPIAQLSNTTIRLITNNTRVWLDISSCSYSVQSAFSAAKQVQKTTPVQLAKSVKNAAEQTAYKDCSLMDSAALVAFLNKLNQQVGAGVRMTELSASALLASYRGKVPDFRGLSFTAIAASGPNAAVIHYRPTEATDREITRTEPFLLDSGGQYLGCTTDVTRTLFYGDKPQEEVRDAYTRVLMGVIDLFNLTWPQRLNTRVVDSFARHNLWAVMKDYAHGTGHGIGLFLGVHEGPNGIGRDFPLVEGNFQSIEPGYYQPESAGVLGFGIRLETISGVKKNGDFLRFEPVTWVPFERKLIRPEMLTSDQLRWLNWYHAECRKRLPAALSQLGEEAAVGEWLNAATEPIGIEVKSADGLLGRRSTWSAFLGTVAPVLLVNLLISAAN